MSRPSKYKEEYCNMLVEHCKKGFDISSFGATIGVSRAVVYKWVDKYPDFKQAHEFGISYLKMKVTERLINFAEGRMERNASVIAAIYLAKVYGVRDDQPLIIEENNKKHDIKLSYNLDNLIKNEEKEEDKKIIEAEFVETKENK